MHNLLFGLALSDCLKIWPDFNYEFFCLPMYIYLLPRYIYTQMKANYECLIIVWMCAGLRSEDSGCVDSRISQVHLCGQGKMLRLFTHLFFL